MAQIIMGHGASCCFGASWHQQASTRAAARAARIGPRLALSRA